MLKKSLHQFGVADDLHIVLIKKRQNFSKCFQLDRQLFTQMLGKPKCSHWPGLADDLLLVGAGHRIETPKAEEHAIVVDPGGSLPEGVAAVEGEPCAVAIYA